MISISSFWFQNTCLHLAAIEGHPNVVTLLLNMGAKITLNEDGLHALDLGIEQGKKDVCVAIIAHDRWHILLLSLTTGDIFCYHRSRQVTYSAIIVTYPAIIAHDKLHILLLSLTTRDIFCYCLSRTIDIFCYYCSQQVTYSAIIAHGRWPNI